VPPMARWIHGMVRRGRHCPRHRPALRLIPPVLPSPACGMEGSGEQSRSDKPLKNNTTMKTNPALSALRHHVSGAIARGEAQAITEVPATPRPTHTPGPWDVNEPDSKGGVWVDSQDGLTVARVGGGVSPVAEAIANARLIAAAPTMLAACMSALRALEDNLQPGPMDEDAKEGLRAAIAKATGGNAS
jgi:hypothetical protein